MKTNAESGFSYIDVMIALVILMVGVLALLSGISASIVQSRGHEQQQLAKQYAISTLESIMSVKEYSASTLGWNAVGNVGSNPDAYGNPQGIFVTGFNPVMSDAGPDQILGTADDTGTQVSGLQRRIVVTDVCDPDRPSPICAPPGTYAIRVRMVEVTIRYNVGGLQRDETVRTILTDYAATTN